MAASAMTMTLHRNKHTGRTEAWRGWNPRCFVVARYRSHLIGLVGTAVTPGTAVTLLEPTATEVSFCGCHLGYRSHPV